MIKLQQIFYFAPHRNLQPHKCYYFFAKKMLKSFEFGWCLGTVNDDVGELVVELFKYVRCVFKFHG